MARQQFTPLDVWGVGRGQFYRYVCVANGCASLPSLVSAPESDDT